MSELEESLKRTVFGLNESYKRAEKDLFEETVTASESIKNATGGIASLILERNAEEDSFDTVFTLFLRSEKHYFEISFFSVSSGGYPIKVSASEYMLKRGSYDSYLKSREDISTYYVSLASNSNSKLVLRIAFLIRKNESEKPSDPIT